MQAEEEHPIYSFPKNRDEEIRIFVRKYKGRYYIDLRVWYQVDGTEVFKPTKKGVIFSLGLLSEFKKGIDRLLKAGEKFRNTEEVAVS